MYSGDRTVLFPRLVILTIILGLWANNLDMSHAVVTADWGDVVDVRYSLYLDAGHTDPVAGNVGQTLNFIYLSRGNSVPPEVSALYPQANAGLLEKFKEGIVGAQVNGQKDFKIDAADGYTNPSDDLYGQDLYFSVELLTILYDASEQITTTTTETTTTTSSLSPFQDFNTLILIGGFVALLVGGVILWSFRSSLAFKSALSEEKMSSSVRAKSIQKDRTQLKELRELTESMTGSEVSSEKSEVKFRRRRE